MSQNNSHPELSYAEGKYRLGDGKRDYEPAIRWVRGTVSNLKLVTAYSRRFGSSADTHHPCAKDVTRSIAGTLTLDSGDELAVLGNENLSTRILKISLSRLSQEDEQEYLDRYKSRMSEFNKVIEEDVGAKKPRFILEHYGYDTIPDATLIFTPSDWEIGNDDEWWVGVDLPARIFDAVATDVGQSRVAEMHCSFDFFTLFTDHPYHVPSEKYFTFYVPPSRKKDGDRFTYDPSRIDVIHGVLKELVYADRSAAEPEDDAEENPDETELAAANPTIAPSAVDVTPIVRAIDSVRVVLWALLATVVIEALLR